MLATRMRMAARALLDTAEAVTYLLRDEFTTPDAAPITSPRTAEPGPGTVTFDETDGTWAISAGLLNFTAQSTPTWGEQGFWTGAKTRAAGLMLHNIINLSTWEECGIGWHTAAADVDPDSMEHAIQANTTDGRFDNHNATSIVTGLSTSTNYQLAQILRGTGAFQLAKIGSDWELLWVDAAGATATLYPMFANLDGAGNLDSLRVAQLAAPWTTDNGIATDTIASPIVTDTFTHTADMLLEFTVDTLPSSGNITVRFRQQDVQNRWFVIINQSGAFFLFEEVADNPVQRATNVGPVNAGDRIVIICDDETITGYYDNTQVWSYSSAANFKTATAGQIDQLQTGGAISNLITWPRTLSGTALTELEKYTGA